MPQSPNWTLIVIRAWIDNESIRVRLLSTDAKGKEAETAVSSAEDAAGIVTSWLSALTADPAPPTAEEHLTET